MERFRFLLYDPKKFFSVAVIAFYVLPLAIVGVLAATAAALSGGGGPPAAYTGGAPVAKVMYPDDGSTITVTTTGAVIKQSPGGTPYRQGCVNPANIGGYNSLNDMRGHISPCPNGPHPTTTSSVTTGTPVTCSGYSCCNNCCNTCHNSNQNNMCNYSCNQSKPQKNKNKNCNCHQMNSYSQPSKPQYLGPPVRNNYPPPAQTTTYTTPPTYNQPPMVHYTSPPATTTSYQSPPSTKYKAPPSGNYTKTLPDTGPGNMMAIGGLTTVFATIGHFLYNRRRLA